MLCIAKLYLGNQFAANNHKRRPMMFLSQYTFVNSSTACIYMQATELEVVEDVNVSSRPCVMCYRKNVYCIECSNM